MAMYHSWGSQNAWLRQIHGYNKLHMSRALGARLGIEDDDWVAVISHHGRIEAPAKLMDGVNPDTVWRSEEHTSELQSLMRISYAVFCLKKKKNNKSIQNDK